MLGFSTAMAFMKLKEGVDEMIKYIANEPSVGLYYVQQHAHSSMPYLLNVRDKAVEKIHEVTLHTEDIEDSIYVVRSMTECGLPIADEMIKDINKSLHIMSACQPKRGLITPSTFNYSPFGSQHDGGSSQGYLSSVLNSAKQKAAGLRWLKGEKFTPSMSLSVDGSTTTTPTDNEVDELPVSSSLIGDDGDLATALEDSWR
ncbi:uncharacterized protein A4U43_C08F2640 [Asparagus officinalis]|nr:uncharacterized protein A4U43_C08F2640 [Asparagus officinalis]